jgi:phosphoribosyl 1,2-cyclic phosphodiesterase
MVLFHADVVVAVLASGSRGNCTYVGDGKRGLVIDCGISTRQIRRRLASLGLNDAPLDFALVTHEHADHVAAARVLQNDAAKRSGHPLPIFMTAGTRRGVHPASAPATWSRIEAGAPFEHAGVRVAPFAVPHDTREPVGFAVELSGVRVGVFTDLGRSTHLVERTLTALDVAVVEFNHDVDMLLQGSYPWALKQRVRSAHGHLSNAQAADLLAAGARDAPRLRHVVLAHLSEENNRPDLAWEAAHDGLHRAGASKVEVHVAQQDAPCDVIRIAPPPPAPPARAPRQVARRVGHPPQDLDRQVLLFPT